MKINTIKVYIHIRVHRREKQSVKGVYVHVCGERRKGKKQVWIREVLESGTRKLRE